MLGLTFSFKLDWSSYIISNTKTASKRIGALIFSMKVFSLEVVLFLYKSTLQPCMEYCLHVCTAAPSCYVTLLDKLQKQTCQAVAPSLAAFFELLAHCQNVTDLQMFIWIGSASSISQKRSTCYSAKLHGFSVTIPRCYKDVYVKSFFPYTARLWKSLPIEFFPLINNLIGFNKSRISRQLLNVGYF